MQTTANLKFDKQTGEGKPVTVTISGIRNRREYELLRQAAEEAGLEIKAEQHICDPYSTLLYRELKKVDSPANEKDWNGVNSSQGYQVYQCICGDIWGCRYQWDSGTGSDDNWHNFGKVDPATVKRHY